MLAKKNKFLVLCLLALSISSNTIFPVKFYRETIEHFVQEHPCFNETKIVSDSVFSWRAISGAIIGGLVGFNSKNIKEHVQMGMNRCSQLGGQAAQSAQRLPQWVKTGWAHCSSTTNFLSAYVSDFFQNHISIPLEGESRTIASTCVGALAGLAAGALIKTMSTMQEDAGSPSLWRILVHHGNPFNGFAIFNLRFFFDEKLGRNTLEFYQTYGAKTEFASVKNILVCAHREYNLLILSKASESKIRAFYSRLGQRIRKEVSKLKDSSRYPNEADEVQSPFKDPMPEMKSSIVEKV